MADVDVDVVVIVVVIVIVILIAGEVVLVVEEQLRMVRKSTFDSVLDRPERLDRESEISGY